MILTLENPIDYNEEVIEDKTIDLLINEISDIEHRQFLSILEDTCEEVIKVRLEHLKVSIESYGELINKVLTMLKNFVVMVGKSLMFWKKKFIAFMEDRTEDIKALLPIVENFKNNYNSDSLNEEKYNSIHGNIYVPGNTKEQTITDQFELLMEGIDNLSSTKEDLIKYINDPELNNRKKILELEEDLSDSSFKLMLGIHINSNNENPLVPSRIRVAPLHDACGMLTFDEKLPFNAFINSDDVVSYMNRVGYKLETLGKMFADNSNITNIMRNIEKSYDSLERGTRLKFFDKNSPDANVDVAKIEALVKARDHIAKSKVLLERLSQVMNCYYLSLKFIVTSIEKSCNTITNSTN